MNTNRARIEDLVADIRKGMAPPELEKTAEARALARLSRNEKVAASAEPKDLDSMSLEELLALSQRIVPAKQRESQPEKLAEDQEMAEMVEAAQIAQHAFQQELYLIKQAAALGICRFCKEQPVVSGTSICQKCGSEE